MRSVKSAFSFSISQVRADVLLSIKNAALDEVMILCGTGDNP